MPKLSILHYDRDEPVVSCAACLAMALLADGRGYFGCTVQSLVIEKRQIADAAIFRGVPGPRQIEVVMTATRPVLPLTGGCSCGAIRYDVTSFPLLLYTCNCTDCQRASGSAFALNMPVAATDFHIPPACPKMAGDVAGILPAEITPALSAIPP